VAFKYTIRPKESWEARANQSGSEYENFIKDEYRTYTPIQGENSLRILPPSWENAPHYGYDAWVHYQVGPDRGSVLCNFKMLQTACPICEDRARAERARDEDLARELKPTRRVCVFIINRKDEAQGVLVWSMAYTIDRELAKASKDRSTGQYYFIDDPENGYDIYFDRAGDGLMTKYSGVALSRRPSSIPPHILEWLEDHKLPDVLRHRSYDEVKRLYEGGGRGEAAASSDRRGPATDEPPFDPPAQMPATAAKPPPNGHADNGDDRPASERQPISRPGASAAPPAAAAPAPPANSAPEPNSDAKARAEQLRARFANRD
jgi:hypothetical protein